MTAGTRDVPVFAFQGEGRALVMIEGRRLPLRGVMAVAALSHLVREQLGELAAVDIIMALLALLGGLLEIHIDHLRFQVGWLMAIDAGDGSVRAD